MKVDGLLVVMGVLAVVASASVAAETGPGNPHKGPALYKQHCLRCHGAMLDGKGPEAAKLSKPPADFHKYLSRDEKTGTFCFSASHHSTTIAFISV